MLVFRNFALLFSSTCLPLHFFLEWVAELFRTEKCFLSLLRVLLWKRIPIYYHTLETVHMLFMLICWPLIIITLQDHRSMIKLKFLDWICEQWFSSLMRITSIQAAIFVNRLWMSSTEWSVWTCWGKCFIFFYSSKILDTWLNMVGCSPINFLLLISGEFCWAIFLFSL